MIFLDLKILGFLVDAAVAFQALHQHVEIVGKGNIANFTDSRSYVFDVYFGHVAMRADFLVVAELDEAGIHYVGLFVAPVEGLEVVEIILLRGPNQIILVDHLACFFVAEGAELAVLFGDVRSVDWLPVAWIEFGSLDLNGLLDAH